jgi:hypothetical protein
LQLFDKWADDSDSLIAWGTLSLQQLLQLGQQDLPGSTEASSSSRTFLVPLHWTDSSSEQEVQPADRAVLLQVRCVGFCRTMPSAVCGSTTVQYSVFGCARQLRQAKQKLLNSMP